MRYPPGAAADREALKWELVELEALIVQHAPHSPWCYRRLTGTCRCWRARALRIIRYSPGKGDYQWPSP